MNTARTDEQLALVGVHRRRSQDAPPAPQKARQKRIYIVLVSWARHLADGPQHGGMHMAINASGLDEIDIRRELIARGVEPGFNITSKFIVTRESLDVLPVQVRHEWRIQYRELIRAEREAVGLRAFDAVDMDHAVDCWSLDTKLSRE